MKPSIIPSHSWRWIACIWLLLIGCERPAVDFENRCRDIPISNHHHGYEGITDPTWYVMAPATQNPLNPFQFTGMRYDTPTGSYTALFDIEQRTVEVLAEGSSWASWSVDNWIAFNRPDGHIWLTRPDGSQMQRLTQVSQNYYPRWSPGGNSLIFMSRRDQEVGSAFLWNLATNELEALSFPITSNWDWSPKGDQVVVSQYINSGPDRTCIFDLHSGELLRCIEGLESRGGVVWNRYDHQEIYLSNAEGVFRFRLDSGELLQLLEGCESRRWHIVGVLPDGRLVCHLLERKVIEKDLKLRHYHRHCLVSPEGEVLEEIVFEAVE